MAVSKMRNRFHEPRSDPPSPRRLDDVNANKSLYGNKRETPSIRCHEPAHRPGRGRPPALPGLVRPGGARWAGRTGAAGRPDGAAGRVRRGGRAGRGGTAGRGAVGRPGAGDGRGEVGWARGGGWAGRRLGGLRDRPRREWSICWAEARAKGLPFREASEPRNRWDGSRAAALAGRHVTRDLGKDHEARERVRSTSPDPVGHVRLAGNLEHRNPSASDIHPRNRTPVGNVSLATDDAIQGHRTGPGAIPRNKEGKDGC
jgi:hypothetical protein